MFKYEYSFKGLIPIILVKYRSRMDIAADVLEVAQGGAIKTRIMYKAFLSFPQLKEYLELLQDGGLLDYVAEEKEYHATERGKRFLKMYKEIGQAILPAGIRKKKALA